MTVLDGVRVLDLGRYIAGPLCAALLGDLGADVVRVERVGGAPDRGITPLADGPPDDAGPIFLQCNRGKRGITLDLGDERGRALLSRLVTHSDIVVANLPPAALASLGLDPATVRASAPHVVLVTADAFGPGPWSDRFGFDGVGQAMSGAAHLSGRPDHPDKTVALWVDHATAALAAYGALAALLGRAGTGRGEHVATSLLHTALTVMAGAVTEESVTRPGRVGSWNRSQTVGPADLVATADGHVVVQVVGDVMFRRFARMVGQPSLVDDPRYADDATRGEPRDELAAIAAGVCATRSTDEVLRAFDDAGLATAPVLTPAEVLTHPHVAAAGMLAPVPYPGVDPDPVLVTPPVRIGGAAAPLRRAPTLSEHTDEVLAELGLSTQEIAALRADGVV